MYKTLCAAVILVVGTPAAFAQTERDPVSRNGTMNAVSIDVIRDLAPIGKLRAAINVSNIVEEMKATGFVAKSLARSNQHDAIVAPPEEN